MNKKKWAVGIFSGLLLLIVGLLVVSHHVVTRQHREDMKQYDDVVVTDAQQMATVEGEELLAMAQHVEKNFYNRDAYRKSEFDACAEWIVEELTHAGYEADAIQKQEVTIDLEIPRKSYNLICTKMGTSGKTIVVGAHMDGAGATDNTSGMVLALYEACQLAKVDTEDTLVFVFFTGEEYGLFGSQAYVENLSAQERASIKYMINIDSIGLGDICYMYGGALDEKTGEVTRTEVFDQAYALSESLGLRLQKNPWSSAHPAPNGEVAAESPMTLSGVSDHTAFDEIGIPTLYLEATNWEAGDYDGYTDTAACGGIMNTDKDTLAFGEAHFPGRYLDYMSRYQKLLDTILRNPF